MAVALASLQPAGGAVGILPNAPVIAELTDSTDLDVSKVEVVVDGTSHTVANGGIEYWQITSVSGGAVVDDLTDVYFRALPSWYTGQLSVTIVVKYDGATLSTTSFSVEGNEAQRAACAAWFRAFESDPNDLAGRCALGWNAFAVTVEPATYDLWLAVADTLGSSGAKLWYMVATEIVADVPASLVVATPVLNDVPASLVVEGDALTDNAASLVVQGELLVDAPVSFAVYLELLFDAAVSGVVSREVIADHLASLGVLGVNAATIIDLGVLSDEAVDFYQSLGVTIS